MNRGLWLFCIFSCLHLGLAEPVQAQAPAQGGLETWGAMEIRVPWNTQSPSFWPQSLRLINNFRHAPRVNGFQFNQTRGGPIWNFGPQFSLATNLTAGIEQSQLGRYQSEYRIELEPTWRHQLGAWGLAQRSRLELRFFPTETRPRLRAQIRATWHGGHQAFTPYISEEVLIEPTTTGFNQNRFQVGLSFPLRKDLRLDGGYLWRPRLGSGGWTHDHALTFNIFFAPDIEPLWDDGGSSS